MKGGGRLLAEAPRLSPHEQKSFLVRVLSYEDKRPAGVILGPQLDWAISFSGLTQLLLAVDRPPGLEVPAEADAFLAPVRKKKRRTAARPPFRRPALATFSLRILFYQNASWQGNVHWLEKNKTISFRSALELIVLFDSALSVPVGEAHE